MSAHRGDKSRTEVITCTVLLALSAAVFAFIVLVWWAPRADATRPLPGPGWQRADLCVNRPGVQTVLDITTGHRFRVVATTDRGNICRPIHRPERGQS